MFSRSPIWIRRKFGWLVVPFVLASTLASTAADPAGPTAELAEVLKSFRAEGPTGWSFIQRTEGDGHSRVERYDASRPDFDRWTLLEQDGRPPTADEAQQYRALLSRRSRGGTAPRLTDQFDLATAEVLSRDADRITYRFRLKTTEEEDATARHLRATVVVHVPSSTVEQVELEAAESFSPTFGVRIDEMKTTLRYSLPAENRPSLLLQTKTRQRGRAFWIKSLDADLTVTFSDHEKARGRTRG